MTEKIRWREHLTKAEPERMRIKWQYRDYILRVLAEHSGPVHRPNVIKRVGELRNFAGATVPRTLKDTVQQAFERH